MVQPGQQEQLCEGTPGRASISNTLILFCSKPPAKKARKDGFGLQTTEDAAELRETAAAGLGSLGAGPAVHNLPTKNQVPGISLPLL